jgi:hypothetical protein
MLARPFRAEPGQSRPAPRIAKRCARCREIKPATNFYASTGSRLSARCKDCHGLATRTCIVCGSSFEGRSNAKLCSDLCRQTHRPQTFLICRHCSQRFGPVSHLRRKFCSTACSAAARATGRRPPQKPTPQARRAQRRVAYYVKTGKLQRPSSCSSCGRIARIEAAHENYDDPLAIRWLCKSCHSKWDWHEPKGGAVPHATSRRRAADPSSSSKEAFRGAARSDRAYPPLGKSEKPGARRSSHTPPKKPPPRALPAAA